eukprot:147281-Rhodomonas_salina.2
MQCPLLTYTALLPGLQGARGGPGRVPPSVLCACYAMSGTDVGCAGTSALSAYAHAVRCPVLTWRVAEQDTLHPTQDRSVSVSCRHSTACMESRSSQQDDSVEVKSAR